MSRQGKGWSGVGGARDPAQHPTAHRPVPGGLSEPGVRAGGQVGTLGGRPTLMQRSTPRSSRFHSGSERSFVPFAELAPVPGSGGSWGCYRQRGPSSQVQASSCVPGCPVSFMGSENSEQEQDGHWHFGPDPGRSEWETWSQKVMSPGVSSRLHGDLRCCAPWARAGQGAGGHTAGAWPGQRTRVAHTTISAGRFLVPTPSAQGSGPRGPAGPAVVLPEKGKVSSAGPRPQQSPAHSEKTSVSPCIFILISINGIFSNGDWEMDLVFKKYVDFGDKVQRNDAVLHMHTSNPGCPAPPLSADCGPEHDPPAMPPAQVNECLPVWVRAAWLCPAAFPGSHVCDRPGRP